MVSKTNNRTGGLRTRGAGKGTSRRETAYTRDYPSPSRDPTYCLGRTGLPFRHPPDESGNQPNPYHDADEERAISDAFPAEGNAEETTTAQCAGPKDTDKRVEKGPGPKRQYSRRYPAASLTYRPPSYEQKGHQEETQRGRGHLLGGTVARDGLPAKRPCRRQPR